jgi:PadR family transcriptional regulator PadR
MSLLDIRANRRYSPPMRLTMTTMAVMDEIASEMALGERAWGLQICDATGLGTGTVYPILERLADMGWIAASWEAAQPSGRPRRRFYEITNVGRNAYAEARAARSNRGNRKRHPNQVGWLAT